MVKGRVTRGCAQKAYLDSRAQSGAVFRLMVDAIIGLVILAAILSTLAYFDNMRWITSRADFEKLVVSSTESPDGKIFESAKLVFRKGDIFTNQGISSQTAIPKECFSFQSGVSIIETTDEKAEVKSNIETIVFTQCSSCSVDGCSFCCLISFGKKLT